MMPVSADLKHLALAAMLGNTAQAGSRISVHAGFVILALFMVLISAGFLIAAGYNALYVEYGPTASSLYMGLIVLVCALLAAGSAYLLTRRQQVITQTYQKMLIENLHHTFDAITEELEEPIQENPKTAALISGLMGFAAAKRLF